MVETVKSYFRFMWQKCIYPSFEFAWGSANNLAGSVFVGGFTMFLGTLNFLQGTNPYFPALNNLITLVIYTAIAWILLALFQGIFIAPFWAYKEREKEAKKKEAELNLQILEQERFVNKIKIQAQKEKLELENKIKELTTPKFELTFKDSQKYVRFTPTRTYQSGQYTPSQEDAYYVRVKLTNISTAPVKNIRITLLNVEFLVNGKFAETDYADQLVLGGTKPLIPELSPGTNAYIDVLSIKEQNNEVKIESLRQLFAHAKLFEKAGIYKLDIQADADDCPSSKISLEFTYDRAGRFIRSDIKVLTQEKFSYFSSAFPFYPSPIEPQTVNHQS